jgi:hypothetical protein
MLTGRRIYKGSFWDSLSHEGKFVDANGDMYEGTWRHFKREGEGIQVYAVDGKTSLPGCDYTWNAGDVYEGGNKANSRHGACRYTFFNGDMAVGVNFQAGFQASASLSVRVLTRTSPSQCCNGLPPKIMHSGAFQPFV